MPGGDRSGDDREPGRAADPLGEAVAAFLADLLDNVSVDVTTGTDRAVDGEEVLPAEPMRGADGRTRQFRLRSTVGPTSVPGEESSHFPDELADLPAAALRALERMTRSASAEDQVHPSLSRALHDVVVAEVLGDRLVGRLDVEADVDQVAMVVAKTLEYTMELATTSLEGKPATHGVVLCADRRGLVPVQPRVEYPGRLPTRKGTPLLFDGSESALAVTATGDVLGEVNRRSLPDAPPGAPTMSFFDEFPGMNGGLTAAASAVFRGVGVFLRADRSIWVFDDGKPLFVRRTSRWKSIAADSFALWLETFGDLAAEVATILVGAVLRASTQGTGAIFAIASDASMLADVIPTKDLVETGWGGPAGSTVDDDVRAVLAGSELRTSSALARLARLDGATIVDPAGSVLAYGAIVRSADSRGEGARTAAARALSLRTRFAVSVSQDGPVSVFHHGELALEFL